MTQDTNTQPNTFTLLLRVRYSECDPQNVVFNARYGDYIDIAMTEYFRSAVGGFQTLLAKGLDNQVVSLHIDWFSSAKFDDVLAIKVCPAKVGNTSYQFELDITQKGSAKRVATGKITYVMVDAEQYQKAPIPAWLREALANPKFQSLVVDQAGS